MPMFQEAHMHKSIFALLAVTLSASNAHAAQKNIAPQDTPVALFKAIYGQYPDSEPADAWHRADKEWLGKGADMHVPTFETLPLSHDTAELNKRVQKAIGKSGEVCIDFDQISDSQDPNIAKYKIVEKEQSNGRATFEISITGTWRKDVSRITYVLVEEKGKWRVDDIVNYAADKKGRAEKSSAREMLKNCL
jgi:hypothetical protein